MESLTIAIPAFNEEESLSDVVTKALQVAPSVAKDFEILLVNDGSTDDTGKIADQLAQKFSRVRVIHHKRNMGFSGAITTCYRKATSDLIFLMPADGQIDAFDVKHFMEKIASADVVVGYRTKSHESFIRKFNSMIFHFLFRVLFGIPLKEISTSILWRKHVLDKIEITANPRSALIELEVIVKAWRMGARFKQVGIPFYPRLRGKAKGANLIMILATLGEIARLWWTINVTRRHFPWFFTVLLLSIGVSIAIRFLYIPYAVVCWDEAVALLWTYAVHAAIQSKDIPLLVQFLSQQFFYPPLFSVFLSLPLLLFSFTIQNARTAGLFWFVIASLGTFYLGYSFGGKHKSIIGFIASILFLTSPMMIFHASIALREMIAVAWSLIAMLAYLWARRGKETWKYLAASLPLIAIAGIKYQYLVVFVGAFGIEGIVSVVFFKRKLETIINHLYLFLPVCILLLFWIFYPTDQWNLFMNILINTNTIGYIGTSGRPIMDYLLFHPRAFLYMYSASWIIGVFLLLSFIGAIRLLKNTTIRVFWIAIVFNLTILMFHPINIQERYSILVMPYMFVLGAYFLVSAATHIQTKLLLLGCFIIAIPIGMDLIHLPMYVYAVGSQTIKSPMFNQLDYNDTWFNYDRSTWPKIPPWKSKEHPQDVVDFVMNNVDLSKRVDFLGRPGELSPDLWNLSSFMKRARGDYPRLPYKQCIATVEILPYSRYNTRDFQLLNAWRIKEIREVENDSNYHITAQKTFEELGIKVTIFAL
jgi:glycosyltransferase involved in cell wall biosynthesis